MQSSNTSSRHAALTGLAVFMLWGCSTHTGGAGIKLDSAVGSGGHTTAGSGGTTSSGGSASAGGAVGSGGGIGLGGATGGKTVNGGATASDAGSGGAAGGQPGSGGGPATGGATNTGVSAGGTNSAGGNTGVGSGGASGGTPSTGGRGTGGMIGSGGGSGGTPSMGGRGTGGGAPTGTGGAAASGGATAGVGGATTGLGPNCGSGDPNLVGIEPTWPSVCQEISSSGTDIQGALTACAGKGAVKLTGAGVSYTSGALSIPGGTFLWVDKGATLFTTGVGSHATIETAGDGAGIVGEGTIDGSKAPAGSTLIQSAKNNFVMYKINLTNSQKMHVKVQGDHFVIWGTTLITPPTAANTDGIDPGAGQAGVDTSNGYIVCNMISVGDDHIAIKGLQGHVSNLIVAHNAFGAGHGMSIGSETGNGGIDGVQVYDLTIDGDVYPGAKPVNANGIRIKSFEGAGGVVDHVQYDDICGRNLSYAIRIDPNYSGSVTGGGTPDFRNVTFKNYHVLKGSGSQTPTTMLNGTGKTAVTLDDVVVDGLASLSVGSGISVTVGAGGASPAPTGASGGSPKAIDCSQRFATFPVHY